MTDNRRIAQWDSVRDSLDGDEVDFFTLSGVEPGTTVYLYMAGEDRTGYYVDAELDVIRSDGTRIVYNDDLEEEDGAPDGTPEGFDITGIFPAESDYRYLNSFVSFEYQPGMVIKARDLESLPDGEYELYASTGQLILNSQSPTSGDDVIEGTGGADTIDGLAGGDIILGLAGNDTLTGGAGVDILSGGNGTDTLNGGAGADELDGGADDDTLDGGAGGDILDGGAGRDTADYAESGAGVAVNLETGQGSGGHAEGDTLRNIEGIAGSEHADILTGDGGDNRLLGLAGSDRLDGGAGADELDGGAGADELDGGADDDTLDGGAGADQLDGGSGLDAATYAKSGVGVTVNLATGQGRGGQAEGDTLRNIEGIVGSEHDDILTGDGGANGLIGGEGNDVLEGGAGTDILAGNSGLDTASYAGSDAGVTVDLGTGTTQGGDAQGDRMFNIENLQGSAHADILTGDGGANRLAGLAGNDTLTGGADGDTLDGGAGADQLDGGAGRDTADYAESGAGVAVNLATGQGSGGHAEGDTLRNIEGIAGSEHADILTGDRGANRLLGLDGDDILSGGDGGDGLYGGEGSDELYGDAGDDRLAGGAGADELDGDAGQDTAVYAESDAGVTVSLETGQGSGGHAEGDTLSNIEGITGSAHADSLTGDGRANRLRGLEGIDELDGGAGNDWLTGGDGNDTLNGGTGDDRLGGGEGGDMLDGGSGQDTAAYAASGAGVTVNLATGQGSGGQAEGDTLRNIEGIVGSAHDDSLTGDGGANGLSGRAGNDRLSGGAGDDTLEGGDGTDRLTGGDGADMLDGGSGQDTASYEGSDAGVTVNLATGQVSGGHAEGDTLRNIEGITGSAHADSLTGNRGANRLRGLDGDDEMDGGDGNDVLTGGDGNDTLNGGTGDDRLGGGDGADILDGGSGQDTAAYGGSDVGVTVNLATGRASGGRAEGDTLRNIEGIAGSAHADSLTGDGGANGLSGRAGADRLTGGAGSDILDGGSGQDTASYADSDVGVAVNLERGRGSGGDAHGDTLRNIEDVEGSAQNDFLSGDAGANRLSGGGGNDRLSGGAGDDTLEGSDGNDVFDGGAGADQLDGGSGLDIAVYAASGAGVTVNLETGQGSGGRAEGDTLSNIEGILGSAHDDILTGGGGANGLIGGDGNDVLEGGDGSDFLVGGAGQDTASYAGSDAGVTVGLGTGTAQRGGDAQGDRLFNIENLQGSAHADNLTGDGGANGLSGGAGADVLSGGGGDDTLEGGYGDDRLTGGDGSDRFRFVSGEGGSDTITDFDPQNDTLVFAPGVSAQTFADIDALRQAASVNADGHLEITRPGAGTITLENVENADLLTNDNVAFQDGEGRRVLTGTSGNDISSNSGGNDMPLIGTDGDDVIRGLAGNDDLRGGAGDDVLEGGAGGDFLQGGAGHDVFTFRPVAGPASTDLLQDFDPSEDRLEFVGFDTGSLAAFKQTISNSNGLGGPSRDNPDERSIYHTSGFKFSLPTADTISLGGFNRDDVLASLTDDNVRFYTENGERLWNGTDGDDELAGTDGDDVIRGLADNDTLEGGDGGDTLDGGAGADQLDGGSGQDTAVYAASSAGVTVNLATGQGSGGHAESDTLSNIENLLGSEHADSLTGDGGDNRLAGLADDDELYGGDGNDSLYGGAGADELDGGSGQDTAVYAASDAGVTVNLATGQGSGGHAEGDTLSNIEEIEGSFHDDSLTGDDDDNRLSGDDGDDVLEGGTGNDVLDGGAGRDTASYAKSGAGVTVNLSSGTSLIFDPSDLSVSKMDTLRNIEDVEGSAHDDVLDGDAGANGLSGGVGADVLSGGAGDDILDGGAGDDRLTGGDGADRFRFVSGEGGSDTITDFDPQNDTLVFAPGTSAQTFADIDALRQAASVNADGHLEITRPGAGTITLLNIGDANQLTTDNVAIQDGEGRRVLTGTSGDDTLAGTDGDDVIRGLAGDDDLRGGAGDDVLEGGAGQDFIQGAAGHDVFTFRPVTGAASNDLLVGFDPSEDRLEFVGFDTGSLAAFKQSITSTYANNEFVFGPARGNPDDTGLYSTGFRFSLPTADSIFLSDFFDSDDLLAALTDDNVRFYTENGERLWAGTDGDDELTGTDGNDVIRGLAGDDTLEGGDGNDVLDGGAGEDVLDGGAGRDTASYANADTSVTVDLSVGNGRIVDFSDFSAEDDTLRNIEDVEGSAYIDNLYGDGGDNRLSGGGGNDRLEGDAGNDRLEGGAGNDRLEGGAGVDVLTGGEGADIFVFSNSSDADGDSILDFEDGQDRIEIFGATFADLSFADVDGDTTVTWGDSEFRIVGVQSTDITVDDFAFL